MVYHVNLTHILLRDLTCGSNTWVAWPGLATRYCLHNKLKKKTNQINFWIRSLKIQKKIKSWDWAKPSSYWVKISSQVHFKFQDLSHWTMIRPSQDLTSQNLSHQAEIQAIELWYRLSRVEPIDLSLILLPTFKGFIKITPWVWKGMLRNISHIV